MAGLFEFGGRTSHFIKLEPFFDKLDVCKLLTTDFVCFRRPWTELFCLLHFLMRHTFEINSQTTHNIFRNILYIIYNSSSTFYRLVVPKVRVCPSVGTWSINLLDPFRYCILPSRNMTGLPIWNSYVISNETTKCFVPCLPFSAICLTGLIFCIVPLRIDKSLTFETKMQ
jgi:hypothetical protein